MELKNKEQTFAIIGAAMEVHRQLGNGFLEKAYQEALAIELSERGIPYKREVHLTITYKGHPLTQDYFVDFVCYDDIIVEIKAVSQILPEHKSQVLNYLNCAKADIGLLINFGQKSLEYQRVCLFHD